MDFGNKVTRAQQKEKRTMNTNNPVEYIPQILDPKSAAQAALKAYDEGRLGFQIKGSNNGCYYNYAHSGLPNSCCGIGAVLSPRTIKQINENSCNRFGVGVLSDEGIVSFADDDEGLLKKLQDLHDYAVNPPGLKQRGTAVRKFLSYARRIAAGGRD